VFAWPRALGVLLDLLSHIEAVIVSELYRS